MYDEIKYNEYNLEQRDYINEIAKKIQMPIEETNVLVNAFLKKIHEEWLEEYKKKYGEDKAKRYIEDMEAINKEVIVPSINENKYNDMLKELKIDYLDKNNYKGEYTKKWKATKDDTERRKIVKESEQKIEETYQQMIQEIIDRKSEFDSKLQGYINIKNENLKIIEKEEKKDKIANVWHYIIVIITAILLMSKLNAFDILGILIFISIAIIEKVILTSIYNNLKWPYIEKVFILPIFILLVSMAI